MHATETNGTDAHEAPQLTPGLRPLSEPGVWEEFKLHVTRCLERDAAEWTATERRREMLVLSRRQGEAVVIGTGHGDVRVTVVAGSCRLGIQAPSAVRVLRGELLGEGGGT